MEVNHDNLNYPKIIKLMGSNKKTQCQNVRRVLRYHTPNKYRFPEKYVYHLLFLFFPFRSEEQLLGGHLSTCQGKLAEPGVMDIINENQQKFEPYAAIVDRGYENLNSEFVDNKDAHGQIENDKTGEPIYREDTEPTEQNSQVHESNLALEDLIPKIATDDEITANIKNLNKKQHMVLDKLHQWARNYVKNVSSKKKKKKKKIFRLNQFIYFYLVVEAPGRLTWLKYIKLCQKNYFSILKNQINHVFSFWIQQA